MDLNLEFPSHYNTIKVNHQHNIKSFVVDCGNVTNGDIVFCNCHTCSENEGDCDSHDECQDDLVCGSNNCPASLGFDSEVDCCYQATVGDDDFCTTTNPCGHDEGDCDDHDECQDGHLCGFKNCLLDLGFNSDIDCCKKGKERVCYY